MLRKFWQRERGNGKLLFRTQVEYVTAGHQDFEGWTCWQQVFQERSRLHHMLKIVQEEQGVLVLECALHLIQQGKSSMLLQVQGLSKRRHYQARFSDHGQRHHVNPIAERVLHLSSDVQRQACFADASWPQERQQPHRRTGEQFTEHVHFSLTSDQRRECC